MVKGTVSEPSSLGGLSATAGPPASYPAARIAGVPTRAHHRSGPASVGNDQALISRADCARGADYFTTRLDPERETRRLIARLQALGHTVSLTPAAA